MDTRHQAFIESYAHRLNESKGNLMVLSKDERKHLRILLRLNETELDLANLAEKVGQEPLPLKYEPREEPPSDPILADDFKPKRRRKA